MRRVSYILILILSGILFSCETKLTVEPGFETHFVKYFGLKGDQKARDMQVLGDGYVLLGSTDSDNLGTQIYLVKTDKLGNEQWSFTYGGIYNEEPASISLTSTGQLLVSSSMYYPDGSSDIKVYLINDAGVKLDSMIYGTPGTFEIASDAIGLSDGGNLILGTTNNVVGKLTEMVVLRTTPGTLGLLPETEWRRNHGEGDNDSAAGLAELNGKFYVFGTSNSDNSQTGGFNMIIFDLDNTGEQNQATFWGTDDDQIAARILQIEGGFLLYGTSTNGAATSYVIQRITQAQVPSGSPSLILSNKTNVMARDILNIGTAYIILGTELAGVEDNNIYLAKIDPLNGELIWETVFGGSELDDAASGLYQDTDGGVVFLATVDLESQTKMALIKVNESGLLTP